MIFPFFMLIKEKKTLLFSIFMQQPKTGWIKSVLNNEWKFEIFFNSVVTQNYHEFIILGQ